METRRIFPAFECAILQQVLAVGDSMWRNAVPLDDEAVVQMCVVFNTEDPGAHPVPSEHMRRTLQALREVPERGLALVLEVAREPAGYALVIPFWSNELGGQVSVIDELYVAKVHRQLGHASRLIEDLAAGRFVGDAVALTLEVTPRNARARRLYERLGFHGSNVCMRRRLG